MLIMALLTSPEFWVRLGSITVLNLLLSEVSGWPW